MKAAVYLGKESLVVQDVPGLSLADGAALLGIRACPVCGTDLRTVTHTRPLERICEAFELLGSGEAGKRILAAAAPQLKKVSRARRAVPGDRLRRC